MTQTQIIAGLMKKCQAARKAWLADSTNKELEEEWTKWSVAIEQLSIVLQENADKVSEYEQERQRRCEEMVDDTPSLANTFNGFPTDY